MLTWALLAAILCGCDAPFERTNCVAKLEAYLQFGAEVPSPGYACLSSIQPSQVTKSHLVLAIEPVSTIAPAKRTPEWAKFRRDTVSALLALRHDLSNDHDLMYLAVSNGDIEVIRMLAKTIHFTDLNSSKVIGAATTPCRAEVVSLLIELDPSLSQMLTGICSASLSKQNQTANPASCTIAQTNHRFVSLIAGRQLESVRCENGVKLV